jgi:hypothetical protein
MNNLLISLIISSVTTFFVVISEPKKENRQSVGIRTFIISYLVSFVALIYLVSDNFTSQDIETCEPNF